MGVELLPLIVGIGFIVVVVAIARRGDRPAQRRTNPGPSPNSKPWTSPHAPFVHTPSTDSVTPTPPADNPTSEPPSHHDHQSHSHHHSHHDATPSFDTTSTSVDAGSATGGGCGE